MITREHLSSLARSIKKNTIYKVSGGDPFPSSRITDLRKMFTGSLWNEHRLDFVNHEPRRIDFGLEVIDEARLDILSTERTTPLELHVVRRAALEVFPPKIKARDLLVMTRIDPTLYPDGYLTSTREPSTEPAEWMDKLSSQPNTFDLTLLTLESGVNRTLLERLRRELGV